MLNWLRRLFKKQPVSQTPIMKYLVVGLGNIGSDYADTRHNVGFDVLDRMAAEKGVAFKSESQGSIAEIKHKGRTFVLLKPSTYMNRSGKAARHWLTKLKLEKDRMIVVVDDLNLPFGKIRLRGKGSAGGHNGLKDIDQMTGGNDYARLRIGIGDDFAKGRQVDFVLGKWSNKEADELPEICDRASQAIYDFGSIGLGRAMTEVNKG